MIKDKWYRFLFNNTTGDDYMFPFVMLLLITGFILGAVVAS